MKEQTDHILALIEKAANANDSSEAMRFSQAALNAANAMCSLHSVADRGLAKQLKAPAYSNDNVSSKA